MADLMGSPGELRFTIQIKRAATGDVETYDMVGRVLPDQETETNEVENGSDTLDSGA